MKALNILIVEDDFSFSLELEMLVKKIGYQVAGVVDNSDDAFAIINTKRVDLILMDIDIKGNLSGLDIGKKIQHLDIPILYITSYEDNEHYDKACQSKMIGYLVKPVSMISLTSTINLAVSSLTSIKNKSNGSTSDEETDFILNDFLFFKRQKVYHKIDKMDIVAIEADRDYISVYTNKDEKFFARLTLSKIESLLPPNFFLRTHRSYIVQIKAIERIDFSNSTIFIQNLSIPVSRSKRKMLEAAINKFE